MDLIYFLEAHWTIILAILGFVATFVRLQVGLSQLKEENMELSKQFSEVQVKNYERFVEIEKDIKTMNPIWQEIRERLARIETSLQIHFKDK